ncbi:MAG: hypothetical protein CFE31_08005 [Rhizobiales bacterium PAR1]|nr:MAG: hypothetical protein CFE31_08005 [Rhizobiales bacterium PAR1]
MRRLRLWLSGAFLLAFFGLWFGERPGDPQLMAGASFDPARPVIVVSHGYHSGVILSRATLTEIASRKGHQGLIQLAARFGGFEWLEIGWGAEDFYRNVARLELRTLPHALGALFLPGNASVLHIVGFSVPPEKAFPFSDLRSVPISDAGFERLAAELEGAIALDQTGQVQDLGSGLYGPSRFFRAHGAFSILTVCNHWVAGLLNVAGLRVNQLLAILPQGLMIDITLRSGARRLTLIL